MMLNLQVGAYHLHMIFFHLKVLAVSTQPDGDL